MQALEDSISNFDNWAQPWTFRDYILNDKTLTDIEINVFTEIWAKAGSYELWKNGDLDLCCKASEEFIAKHYDLTATTISKIVRALSYQWR